MLLTVL
jgi:T-complex protein 1 subunit alpha